MMECYFGTKLHISPEKRYVRFPREGGFLHMPLPQPRCGAFP